MRSVKNGKIWLNARGKPSPYLDAYGPFGYHLHRQLTAMGVTNYVVQPQVWDERHKGVKTDKLDALALCQRLDRFVLGNRIILSKLRLCGEASPLLMPLLRPQELGVIRHFSSFSIPSLPLSDPARVSPRSASPCCLDWHANSIASYSNDG